MALEGFNVSWIAFYFLTSESYLLNKTSWNDCKEPPKIVLWHIVLFSIMLAIAALQFVLCAFQLINSLIGIMCGDCRKKQKVSTSKVLYTYIHIGT